MATLDIGYVLFVQLLGMTQYPGSPFTGSIPRDLIMFFIVPSIFIILVVYMTVGRILAPEQVRMRLLLGVGLYLFIVAGGYYPVFALLAGPYFIILIFIIGILGFFLGHFRSRPAQAAAGGGGTYAAAPAEFKRNAGILRRTFNPLERREEEEQYKTVLETLAYAKGRADKPGEIAELMNRKTSLEVRLFGHTLTRAEIKRRFQIEI